MPGLNLPIGVALKDWRVEIWFELRLSTNEKGEYEDAGYYLDRELAEMHGRGKGWYNSDGKVVEVQVLTSDGKSGYVISMKPVDLTLETKAKKEVMDSIKEKLSPEERKYIGM